jgi:hypothetical protein
MHLVCNKALKQYWEKIQQRQNPKGEPALHQTWRAIHLSAGQQPKRQSQMYTGVAYQKHSECS